MSDRKFGIELVAEILAECRKEHGADMAAYNREAEERLEVAIALGLLTWRDIIVHLEAEEVVRRAMA